VSPNPTILVVDDEHGIRELVELRLRDYTVRTAADGIEALALLDDGVDVDLILLDLHLPHLAGEELLEQLRDAGYGGPVVVYTGAAPDSGVIPDGVDDVLVKPVSTDTLRETVADLLPSPFPRR
jgi:CheY-like chemotaxis protein